MPLQKIGINISNIGNLTTPDFDLANNSQDLINDIPTKANEITGGWIGLISLSALFTFLMWKLNQDQVMAGDYGYSTARGIGLAAAVCSICGLYMLNIGYFTNFYHVTIFIVISMIATGVVYRSTI